MPTLCARCEEPLVLIVDDSDDSDVEMGGASASSSAAQDEKTVPDDVHLRCGCHFHWQCLLDAYSVTACPSCSSDLISQSSTGQQQILCNLKNEGGLQRELDILPQLTEEGYLNTHPEERKARAFLEFCRTGDVPAIVELLQGSDGDLDDEDDDQMTDIDVLRYQDPIGEKSSGLHAAVAGKSPEVAWLLLLLASDLDLQRFPAVVFQEAGALQITRHDIEGKPDIRSLRDAHGRTAEQLAAEVDGPWSDWLGRGLLAIY